MVALPALDAGSGVGAAAAAGSRLEAATGVDVVKTCAHGSATSTASTLTTADGRVVRREND